MSGLRKPLPLYNRRVKERSRRVGVEFVEFGGPQSLVGVVQPPKADIKSTVNTAAGRFSVPRPDDLLDCKFGDCHLLCHGRRVPADYFSCLAAHFEDIFSGLDKQLDLLCCEGVVPVIWPVFGAGVQGVYKTLTLDQFGVVGSGFDLYSTHDGTYGVDFRL